LLINILINLRGLIGMRILLSVFKEGVDSALLVNDNHGFRSNNDLLYLDL